MLSNLRATPDSALSNYRYRALAPEYDASCKYIVDIRTEAIETLALKAGETVFDVACGTGAKLLALAEKVGPTGRVVGIEHSPSMANIARERIALSGMAEQIRMIESTVETAKLSGLADALLFCYTHDVLQSPAALDNLLRFAAPGARIVVVGVRLQSWWWAAPLNLWVCLRGWQYLTTFRGLREPFRGLLYGCPDLRIVKTFHLGTSYLATGYVSARREQSSTTAGALYRNHLT